MPTNSEQVWTVERVEELLAKITEPPWEIYESPEAIRNTVYGVGYVAQFESHDIIFIPDSGGAMFDSQEIRANMALAAAAPEIIRYLLDSLTRARQDAEQMRKALEGWVDHEGTSCFVLGADGWCGECARCVTRKALGLPLSKEAIFADAEEEIAAARAVLAETGDK